MLLKEITIIHEKKIKSLEELTKFPPIIVSLQKLEKEDKNKKCIKLWVAFALIYKNYGLT